MLAQAEKGLTYFPNAIYGLEWAKTMLVQYAEQIGRFALENEQDPEKLEKALLIVIKGFHHSNWYKLNDIKDTTVRLLLKLGRPEDAFPIVQEAFKRNPEYADFQDLKNAAQYLTWANEVAQREEEAKQKLEKAYQNYLLLLKEEQVKIKDQFVYPDHPLVKQHAEILNLIKERMLDIRLKRMYRKSGWVTADHTDQDTFILEKMSIEQIQEFEEKNTIRLPDELKVYMMEIGAGGGGYTCYGGEIKIEETQLEVMRKPFSITPDKIHSINHHWDIKAWIYPDRTGWKKSGIVKKEDMQVLFGLAPGTSIEDGCMNFGNSSGQDELFLIMNGAFEGEVWVDTLQYGAEAGGCFAAASAKRFKLLEFIAESLLAKYQGYTEASDQGAWI
jgi:tetratricopeptide (TPR) repeat protein